MSASGRKAVAAVIEGSIEQWVMDAIVPAQVRGVAPSQDQSRSTQDIGCATIAALTPALSRKREREQGGAALSLGRWERARRRGALS